jgi:spore maturation protein CgeB
MSMSCGAMVVSEGNYPSDPFIKDVHFVQAADSDLTETILSYLRNERQRQRITCDAYNYITKENTLKKSILDILQKSNLVDVSQLHLVGK